MIPALDHPQMLERCLGAALAAVDGAQAQLVVALDDGRVGAVDRGLEAVRRASGETPALVRSVQEAESSARELSTARLVCIPTGRLLPRSRLGGKAAALNFVLALHGLWREKTETRARDSYLACIDVDETLSTDGFEVLREAASRHPRAVLIQAPKHDKATTRSWFSRAFSAGYSAWFHWEAGWDSGDANTQVASSYYGSMAAIRLGGLSATEVDIQLADGTTVRGREVFPEQFAVEDYPFAVSSLATLETVLLRRPIGMGCAPPDTPSVLALWHRWAHGNIATTKSKAGQILRGPMQSERQRVAWIYHSMSWYAYLALGLLPLALFGALLSSGLQSTFCLALVCLAATVEWVRRLLPTPMTSFVQRALRLPIDTMLWPVVAHAIFAAWTGTKSSVSRSTPRIAGSRSLPLVVIAVYSLEALVVVATAALAVERSDFLSVTTCALVTAPALIGLGAIALDPRLRVKT